MREENYGELSKNASWNQKHHVMAEQEARVNFLEKMDVNLKSKRRTIR